ncbi:MAG: hypothetical protein HY321_02620 [Armatimonadetes bacterium]|nr:hypothetical protein [Armatimonadota bacterium]
MRNRSIAFCSALESVRARFTSVSAPDEEAHMTVHASMGAVTAVIDPLRIMLIAHLTNDGGPAPGDRLSVVLGFRPIPGSGRRAPYRSRLHHREFNTTTCSHGITG